MSSETTQLIVALIKDMVVVLGFVDVFSRTKLFTRAAKQELTASDKVMLILIFGIFSIFGTLGGELYKGVYINVRDMGPALAGLLGGPLVGLGAGLIGGIHRFTLGGLTCTACSIATVAIGLAGGLIYKYKNGQLISVRGAVLFAILAQCFHLGLGVLISRPLDQAIIAVQTAALPMIFNNVLGGALAIFVLSDVIKMDWFR